jgi:multisubunit Na+/H+ antiporter MnhB subunit
LTPGVRSVKFRSVSKTYGMVSIGLGVVFLFVGALDARGGFGVWAASAIMLGLFLVVFGTSFFVTDEGRKSRRRLSFGFLGAAAVLLVIALALFR